MMKFQAFLILFLIISSVTTLDISAKQSNNLDSIIKKKCCLGWREWATLPQLFKENIMVKVDSGAKTSSLHAENIEIFEKDDEEWVKFTVYPRRDSKKIKYHAQARVIETKNIRSSNGIVTIRPVIKTPISLGGKEWIIELTLINRSLMGYRMLLGRSAFNTKFLLDSEKSFLYSEKKILGTIPSKKKVRNSLKQKSIEYFNSIKGSFFGNFVETIIVFLIFFLIRLYISSMIQKSKVHSSLVKKKFIGYANRTMLLLMVIATLIIWLNEFKAISIYLMAISVSLVLIMREAIKNFHGGFLLLGARSFKIGDVVKIKDIRGRVIETNFMTTKVEEVRENGRKSNGNVITFPNSIFLNTLVKNENHQMNYILHSIVYPLKEGADWKAKEMIFREIIKELTADYYEDAQEVLAKSDQLNLKDLEPKFSYSFPSPERINMEITLLLPRNRKKELESSIIRNFLEKL